MTDLFAYHNLVGKTINGWEVIQQLPKADSSKGETGGNFSICYIVKNSDRKAFMKVFDLARLYLRPYLRLFHELISYKMRLQHLIMKKHYQAIVEIEAYQKSCIL